MKRLLREYEDALYDMVYHNVYEDTYDSMKAELRADKEMEILEDLIKRLEKGECPTSHQKWIIKMALISRCYPDDKDYVVSQILPKLKMRLRPYDLDVICTETEDFTKL